MLLYFEEKKQDINFANLHITKIYQQFETPLRGARMSDKNTQK